MSIEIKPTFIFLILLGHLRTLCPGCRHTPQSCKRLAGGLEIVVLKMEWEGGESSSGVAGREVAVHGEVLMPLLSPGLIGTRTSLSSQGQNIT